MMARYSEMIASSRESDAEVLLAKDSRVKDSSGGVRCFACDRRGHLGTDCKSKKGKEVGSRNPLRHQIAGVIHTLLTPQALTTPCVPFEIRP